MFPQAKLNFPHRHNQDGSYDAICTVCLATVASVTHEDELTAHEAAHRCESSRLAQFSRLPILAGSGFDLLR